MMLRAGKFSKFAIRKASTSSTKVLPNLTINNSVVPPVEIDSSFRYLGHYFNCTMKNYQHMSDLLDTTIL